MRDESFYFLVLGYLKMAKLGFLIEKCCDRKWAVAFKRSCLFTNKYFIN